ncbi:MAG: hypothetical protein ACLPWF_24890 [Bryobacteraceae bacterium]
MELDELKEKWAEYDRKLDVSIRLNQQLLRETYARRARFALWRLAGMLALGAIVTLPIIGVLGGFIAKNWATPKFAIAGMVLDAAAIAALAALIAQIALALSINYNQPVAVIQKRLETLRKFRIRYAQAILLISPLLWAPIFMVAMKGLLGLDVYRLFGLTWIVVNVAFGLGVLALGLWLARRFGARMAGTTFGQRFLRDLAGYNLNAASRFLATLAEFEDESV